MITTDNGKQNIFPNEPQIIVMKNEESVVLFHDAEQLNGRLAMLGFIAALGAYIITGQIIPGIF